MAPPLHLLFSKYHTKKCLLAFRKLISYSTPQPGRKQAQKTGRPIKAYHLNQRRECHEQKNADGDGVDGGNLLLVRLRADREGAVLRRIAQGDKHGAGCVHGNREEEGLALHLQKDQKSAVLRRRACQGIKSPPALGAINKGE